MPVAGCPKRQTEKEGGEREKREREGEGEKNKVGGEGSHEYIDN